MSSQDTTPRKRTVRAKAKSALPTRLEELQALKTHELLALLDRLDVEVPSAPQHQDLVLACMGALAAQGITLHGGGTLEVLPDGFGFLRSSGKDFVAGQDDLYVSPTQIRRFGLRTGSRVGGEIRPPKGTEKYFALLKVEEIEGMSIEERARLPVFEDLTPCYPEERIRLETGKSPLDTRLIDLLVPIGKGQRGLIVAPPKAGKTILLQSLAKAVLTNHPEIHLIVLLVDERPEEVTDFRNRVQGENVQIVASTFDEPASRHTHTAEITLERARRLVEEGKDVMILLDSITRLARAYNTETPSSGKLLSGGVESTALQKPKRFFGSARNLQEGGSLTILGTCLIETGSRMDEVIFEEFKGTGNLEIVLDRQLADRRIFPAIDIQKSGTRREELLIPENELNRIWVLRKVLSSLQPIEATELLLEKLRNSESNAEFLATMKG